MGRFIALLYGLASYVVFLVTFLYAIGVVSGLVGDLLFAAVTTTSIVVSILLEEHDLVDLYCGEYRHYKNYLSMLVLKAAQQHARPRWRGRKLVIFNTFPYYKLGVTFVTCPHIWWAARPALKCPTRAIRSVSVVLREPILFPKKNSELKKRMRGNAATARS
jgi:hypothetical protein